MLPPGKNSSLARAPDGTDTGDNAKDFTVCATVTPGAANTCQAAVDPGDPTKTGGGGGGAACAASGTANGASLALLLAALAGLVLLRRRAHATR